VESKTDKSKEFDVSLSGPTTGHYELFGVVTHQGRIADSGHYVGWTRQSGDNWIKFDDHVVSQCMTEDIKKLCGGGDWHMTYICMFRRVDDLADKPHKHS